MKKYSFLLGFLALIVGCQSEVNSLTEQPEALFARSGPPVSGSSANDISNSGNGGGTSDNIWTAEYFDQNDCGGGTSLNFILLENDSDLPIYVNVFSITTQSEYIISDWSETAASPAIDGFVEILPTSKLNLLLDIPNRPYPNRDVADFEVKFAYKYSRNSQFATIASLSIDKLVVCQRERGIAISD